MLSRILNVLKQGNIGDKVNINGWIRSMRNQKNNIFLDINDGSSIHNIQIVLSANKYKKYELCHILKFKYL